MFEKLFLKNSIHAKVQLLGRPPVHSSLFEQLVGGPACICMCREVQASGQCGELFLGVIHLSCWDLPTWLSWGVGEGQQTAGTSCLCLPVPESWAGANVLSFPMCSGDRTQVLLFERQAFSWLRALFRTQFECQLDMLWPLIQREQRVSLGLALFLLTKKFWSRKKLIIAMCAIPIMRGVF